MEAASATAAVSEKVVEVPPYLVEFFSNGLLVSCDSRVFQVPVACADEVDPRVAKLLQRPRIAQHTPQWYSARTKLITATAVASILGLNPYCSASKLFKQKTGQATAPDYNSEACQYGTDHEQEAADMYSLVTGFRLVPEDIGLVTHPTVGWLAASPDRIHVSAPILVEIKCPFRRVIRRG